MRTFENFNKTGKCPICGTNEDSPPVLIPVVGSNKDGGMTYRAEQIHLKCINLFLHTDTLGDGDWVIEMKFTPKG